MWDLYLAVIIWALQRRSALTLSFLGAGPGALSANAMLHIAANLLLSQDMPGIWSAAFAIAPLTLALRGQALAGASCRRRSRCFSSSPGRQCNCHSPMARLFSQTVCRTFTGKKKTMRELLDGNKVAAQVFGEIRIASDESFRRTGTRPRLAMIYLQDGNLMVETAAELHQVCADRAGCEIELIALPDVCAQASLLARIMDLNFRADVTAIMVLQQLPAHIAVAEIINQILPEREVEGLHPINLARHFPASLERSPFDFCVPQALKMLLKAYDLYHPGKRWVALAHDELIRTDLIAASNIHGRDAARLDPDSGRARPPGSPGNRIEC